MEGRVCAIEDMEGRVCAIEDMEGWYVFSAYDARRHGTMNSARRKAGSY